MAGLLDILAPEVPNDRMMKRLGIKNEFAKMLLDPINLAGLAIAGVGIAGAAKTLSHNKRVKAQLAARFMPAEVAEKTVLRGKTLGDAVYGEYSVANKGWGKQFDIADGPSMRASNVGATGSEAAERKASSGMASLARELKTGTGPIRKATNRPTYTLLGGQVVKDTGKPMTMHHGTTSYFDNVLQEGLNVEDNLYGPGFYQTSSPGTANWYTRQASRAERAPTTAEQTGGQLRQSFIDTRNPFDIEKTYDTGELKGTMGEIARAGATENVRLLEREIKLKKKLVPDANRKIDAMKNQEVMFRDKGDVAAEKFKLAHAEYTEPGHLMSPEFEGFDRIMRDVEKKFVESGAWFESKEYFRRLYKFKRIQQRAYGGDEYSLKVLRDLFIPAARERIYQKDTYLLRLTGEIEDLNGKLSAAMDSSTIKGGELYQTLAGIGRELPSHRSSSVDVMLPETHKGIVDRLASEGVKGSNLGQFAAREMLQEAGFDSIVHRGGRNTSAPHHLVNIAFSPDQIYKPFIAERKKSLADSGVTTALGAFLIAAGFPEETIPESEKRILARGSKNYPSKPRLQ